MASPLVRGHLNRLASGDVGTDWLTWAWGRYVRGRGLRVLVLGCGGGWLERSIAHLPEIASIDACDVAEGAVAQAAASARDLGLDHLRYHVVDLNEEAPPTPGGGGAYHLVVAHSVLHHVENLERAYREIDACLRPGGLVLINEYVGPRRFQFSERQMAVVNGVLARLPERLRRSATSGEVYPHKVVPTEAEMIKTDPSEAVRSNELLAFTRKHFVVLCEVPYGGTVLQHLLYDVVQNFDPADDRDGRLLAAACLLEAALIWEGALPADFAVVVARRRERRIGGGGRSSSPDADRRLRRPPRALCAWERGALTGADVAAVPAAGGGRRRTAHTRPSRDGRHGITLPPVREHLHRLATGDPACDWLSWVLATRRAELTAAGGRTLALDHPGGWLAKRLAAESDLGPVDAWQPQLRDDGRLAPDSAPAASGYGRIFSNGWLGRAAADRERLVERFATALRPGGWLIGDDFLGRPDSRPTPATLAYARELIELLQPSGAPQPTPRERVRARLSALANRLVVRLSPYAAGRSEDALRALLAGRFELDLVRSTDGALLQRVLPAADHLDPADERDAALLRLLAYTEELLTDAGAVQSEYACFLARRT